MQEVKKVGNCQYLIGDNTLKGEMKYVKGYRFKERGKREIR